MREDYLNWIYEMIFGSSYTRLSYRKLLLFLDSKDFSVVTTDNLYFNTDILNDENRLKDGVDFRYIYGYENGYSNERITKEFFNKKCSVLEMMIALAFRIEKQIMTDNVEGDRTGQWFWNMIVSLGLHHMSDESFDISIAESVIDRFMNRQYNYNGSGGLFTLRNPPCNLCNVEIWAQAMWYLDENFEFSL